MRMQTNVRWMVAGILPVLLMTAGILPPAKAAGNTALVTVTTATTYQTLEGFGAATAWMGSWLTQNPNREELYQILFGDLGLDIIRFRNTYRGRVIPGFAETEREILKEAQQSLGHPLKVLLCSWTPPSGLKSNHAANRGTLAQENGTFVYDKFADYWYDSLKAYAAKGIVPDYISIQNEPNYVTDWETCLLREEEGSKAAAYGKTLNAVYTRIKSLPRAPKIIGPETDGISPLMVQGYCENLNLSQLYGIAHHLYNGGNPDRPDSFIQNMEDIAEAFPDKPIFQTEYDKGTPFTTGLLMMNSLVFENAGAYFYWDLVWDPSQRPLVALENPANQNAWTSKKGFILSDFYYVFKQYAKFTDPGFKRIAALSDSKTIRTTAFVSPDKAQVTVILINNGDASAGVALNLKDFRFSGSAVYLTVPGGTQKCSNMGAVASDHSLDLPAKSIATVVFQK